ncbi:hypothetical protein ACFV1L_25220 [Kitasatospora sp. NPDC059646]|uniref:hypothetical protein n=1 Tax=Kitasatospora sp. NPDC059646 TaxID=3346893 RepID=UPI003692EF59
MPSAVEGPELPPGASAFARDRGYCDCTGRRRVKAAAALARIPWSSTGTGMLRSPAHPQDHVPDRFWQAPDAARPRLAAPERWLADQPRKVVEDFTLVHETAQEAPADPAEGVPADGGT